MLERNYRDIAAGALLVIAGIAAAIYAFSNYSMGTINRMGPGMMPASLGTLLALLGLGIVIPGFLRAGDPATIRLRPMIFLSAAVICFALMIERFGLVPTVFVTTVLTTLAESRVGPLRSLILGLIMAFMTWAIFIAGLGLNIPAFDWQL